MDEKRTLAGEYHKAHMLALAGPDSYVPMPPMPGSPPPKWQRLLLALILVVAAVCVVQFVGAAPVSCTGAFLVDGAL